jgi:SAM-dependent methyltransferase
MHTGHRVGLFQEYEKQQEWRNWQSYLPFVPYKRDDTVLDLGCSVGAVSHMFSTRVKSVVGIDTNQEFINFCNSQKRDNENYICDDLLNVSYKSFGEISGVWGSFSLSYIRSPLDYLRTLGSSMSREGWIALLDVACFISGNLAKESTFFERVRAFELESCESGLYDFDFGSKMQDLLKNADFTILHTNDDVTDVELNFNGAASAEVLAGWSARLDRMVKLRTVLGGEYSDFCNELLANLRAESHKKRGNVRFVVAKKSNDRN